MIGPAGFTTAPKPQDEVNEIMAGMDRATDEWLKHIAAIAPRCHFRPMMLEGWGDESWWECSVCGHTKDADRAAKAASQDTTHAPLTRCAAGRDGECGHAQCPQLRDGEPRASGRHCPLDCAASHGTNGETE